MAACESRCSPSVFREALSTDLWPLCLSQSVCYCFSLLLLFPPAPPPSLRQPPRHTGTTVTWSYFTTCFKCGFDFCIFVLWRTTALQRNDTPKSLKRVVNSCWILVLLDDVSSLSTPQCVLIQKKLGRSGSKSIPVLIFLCRENGLAYRLDKRLKVQTHLSCKNLLINNDLMWLMWCLCLWCVLSHIDCFLQYSLTWNSHESPCGISCTGWRFSSVNTHCSLFRLTPWNTVRLPQTHKEQKHLFSCSSNYVCWNGL